MLTIPEIWQSEKFMEEAYKELLHLSKFDRTTDASKLVNKFMDKQMDHPTFYDKRKWVVENIHDFNLASQLLTNCQEGSLRFNVVKLSTQIQEWEKHYENVESSPFQKKAKFLEGEDGATKQHNLVLAAIRNHRFLTEAAKTINSFRVSPIGSTPALADMNNLSQLSINGLSQYLSPGITIWVLNHELIQTGINLHQQDDGGYVACGLYHPIYSKSGGDIVTKAISSRWMTYQLLSRSHYNYYVVPKYDSLLVAGDKLPMDLRGYADELTG